MSREAFGCVPCVWHRAGRTESGAGVEMGSAGGTAGFVQGRNGIFSRNGNLALSRLLALLSASFPCTWIHGSKNFALSCHFPGPLCSSSTAFPFACNGNILLYCHRFPDCRRGEHLSRCIIRTGDPDNFGKELCFFQGFSCCRNPSQYFEIKDPLG